MTRAAALDRAGPKAPGRLSKALLGLFMRRATVAAIEDVADRFRLVTLEGPALLDVTWLPGQKIQIAMGSAFVNRTYTPVDWDAATGRTRFLGYAHGDGPGSAWLQGLAVGNGCDIFGPRSSLDPGSAAPPLAVFGDETSIGLACALRSLNRLAAENCCFEVEDVDGSVRVLARLGLHGAALIQRRADNAHLDEVEAALCPAIEEEATFILTGKAGTIQRLRQSLRWESVPPTRIISKAYWAPGKRGFD